MKLFGAKVIETHNKLKELNFIKLIIKLMIFKNYASYPYFV